VAEEKKELNEENIIVIEVEEEQKKKNKFVLIIIILLLVAVIMLLILAAVIVTKKKKSAEENVNREVVNITKKLEKKPKVQKDELQQLIKKATILYNKGEKLKALQILNNISKYSEALSYYNLGVIKLEEKKYKDALLYFQKAITNKDNRTLSAINATYIALKLKNRKLFEYYRNLAYTFLPEISNSKSYPFYYAVVMYYMGYEYEALAALNSKTPYIDESRKLKSSILEYYGDFEHAQALEHNVFYKGLSLARVGEYSLAQKYLSMADSNLSRFALALVDLKLSDFKDAAAILKKQNANLYPVKVYLKPSLFNIKTAQTEFKNSFLKKKEDFYDLFFYFAPYKVFNMTQTISYLKKGIAGIPIGSIEESQNYLSKSASYSALNIEISHALKLIFNGHISLANHILKKLIKQKDSSYILHYDLALTYAQLGDYVNAYKHFLRAYHLNPSDLKSGIYALMALDKLKKTNKYLYSSVKEDLNENTELEEAMLAVVNNNTVKLAAFLEKPEKNKPLYIITRITAKSLLDKDYTYDALKLKSMFPKDIIANLLYFYAQNKDKPVNKIAMNYQSLFISKNFNMNDFYYGPKIVQDWYFKFAQISGLLNKVRLDLLEKAKKESFDLVPVLKKLAYADLFTKHFEESYTIYNDLINNKHASDIHTLFHAAVAAVAANHHSNAVALMELAKLKDPAFYEARYGLGLLWQEAGNLRAAAIQYGKIPGSFKSGYFDFNIDNR